MITAKFPVIAIGASAGGLEPLELFFENTEPKTQYAFIIIQHLAPNHKSLMDELLARHTQLPIVIITNGLKLKKGHIYLNPPKKFVEIRDNHFILSEKEDRTLSFPISSFFHSLAEDRKENCCAIILSGTGSDGSDGIKFVKEKGGLVLVQNPNEAKFNGMPNSAINTGMVDKVCEISTMHQEINRFFKNKSLFIHNNLIQGINEIVITKVLKKIQQQVHVDFTGYKYASISRRIDKRMIMLSFNNIDDYFEYFNNTPKEISLLAKELLVGVTRFFRDEEAFESLKNNVIPKIIEKNIESKNVRIWIPGCSTGEEAYSIAILIKEYLRINKLQFDVSIFATDLDKEAIKYAGNRIFPESIRTEIPPEYLNTYFISQRNGYTIAKEIREMIVFSVHNIIQDAPFNKIDLISCRNLLIYLKETTQQELFVLFQYALKTNGFLFLGSSESLGEAASEFREFDKKSKIFVNITNKKFIHRPHFISKKNKNFETTVYQEPETFTRSVNFGKNKMLEEIQKVLIQEYVPDSMIIDNDFNLLHTAGNAHKWLQIAPGEITANVLKMLPTSFAMPIEIVARKVINTGKATSLTNIEIPKELKKYFGNNSFLNISIRKKELNNNRNYLFLTFETISKKITHEAFEEINIHTASKDKIEILERELRVSKENLQTTIEELESSNEELQAANEELQSSNEELESVNEELFTVNSEYQQKNQELSQTNDDLRNLIQSTEIALLFLDDNLSIRKYSPAIKNILDLVPHDIGRNISHFRGKINHENFMEQVENVLETLIPYEGNIKDTKGIEYLLKITPFRTNKNEIKGVVMVFIDLTQANKLKYEIEISDKALTELKFKHKNQNEIFELITNNLVDTVCIIDKKGHIVYITPSGSKLTGYSLEDLYKLNFLEQIKEGKEKDVLKKVINNFGKDNQPSLLSFEFKKADGKNRWFESSLKTLNHQKSSDYNFLLTIRDVHEQKIKDQEFYRLSLIAEQTSSAVVITDVDGKITFVNEAFEKMTGYFEESVMGKKPGDFLQGEESDPRMILEMSRCIRNKESFDVDIINYNALNNKYLVNIKAEPMYDKEKCFIGFFSIQNDITSQQEHLNQIQTLNQTIKNQFKKLEEVNKTLEEFAYVTSHDLKTPVRNIKGLLQIIEKKGDSLNKENRNKYFNVIIKSADELNRMIENLLEYSRTGILVEEKNWISLPKAMEEIVHQFDNQLQELDCKIETDLHTKEIFVYPILFKRLFTNLISNSIKYRSKRQLKINISCTKLNDNLVFEVKDNGIGIPENKFEDVFKIFKTLSPNKDSNGIGLSICKKIVEIHEGRIELTSEIDKGSTFRIIFPYEKNYLKF